MKRWYDIKAAGSDHTEIFIYGDIGESWYGDTVSAKQFVDLLQGITTPKITCRVNSFGGSVVDGIAIYNAIKRHPATVTIAIDGLAASIASLIAMAGDEVEIAQNAMLMVHAPWGGAYGNAADLRAYADMLDQWAKAMSGSYATKTGKSVEDVLALLTDGQDHWYTADDALAEGFVDRITDPVEVTARFDGLNRFRSLPAAAAAFIPERQHMDPKNAGQKSADQTNATPTPPAPADVEAIAKAAAQAALVAENKRQAEIRAAFDAFIAKGFPDVAKVRDQFLNDTTVTVDAAKAALLERIGAAQFPAGGGYIETVADARDKARIGIQAALEHRAKLGAKDDPASEFRGMSMVELARACLRAGGHSMVGLGSKLELVKAAFTHSTSDFPKILENIANKSLLKGYEETEETFGAWTRKGTLPDFKTAKRVDLGLFPNLALKPEGAEYQAATIGERGESILLATYGRMWGITREGIINDDMDMLSRVPQRMGRAAKRTVGDAVYAVLTANPVMSDGQTLFHSSHNNLLTAAALNTDSLDLARVAMATQRDPANLASTLGIQLKYLLVPVQLGGLARTIRDSQYKVEASAKNLTIPNSMRGMFEIVEEPRLGIASASNWFGAADPSMHDTIEVAYLDGNETPFTETDGDWDTDGTRMKVRLDFAVKALDFRTFVKNPN